ncbi:MAG: hypothetical protein AAFO07_14120 [Bacteroidota bacterium]
MLKGIDLATLVEQYNRKSQYGLKLFPIEISRPLFSKDQKIAIVVLSMGNDTGRMSIYKYQDSAWKFVVNFMEWIY